MHPEVKATCHVLLTLGGNLCSTPCGLYLVAARLTHPPQLSLYTANVEIFAQYIFSRILRMVSYARKYDVSENLNHYRLDRIRYKMRENISTRNGHIWLDARKFSCAKISTFTV